MRYVALLGPGPAAIPGKPLPAHDPEIMRDHLRSMRRLYDEGALVFGGPYAHGLAGIAVLEAADEATASAMIAADPAVAAGIISFCMEHVWTVFDAATGFAWSPDRDRSVPAVDGVQRHLPSA